jgi:hypothetical protein
MAVVLKYLKEGDVLKHRRNKVPLEVYKIHLRNDRADTASCRPLERWEGQDYNTKGLNDCTLYDGDNYSLSNYTVIGNTKEEKKTMSKLFKVIGEEVYGIHIGTNTAGELVLEIRGDANNAIKAFKKDALEEVKPYTVKLVPLAGTGNPRHATVEKDKLKQNDVIVYGATIWTVAELDTKQDNCSELSAKNCKRLVVGEL